MSKFADLSAVLYNTLSFKLTNIDFVIKKAKTVEEILIKKQFIINTFIANTFVTDTTLVISLILLFL